MTSTFQHQRKRLQDSASQQTVPYSNKRVRLDDSLHQARRSGSSEYAAGLMGALAKAASHFADQQFRSDASLQAEGDNDEDEGEYVVIDEQSDDTDSEQSQASYVPDVSQESALQPQDQFQEESEDEQVGQDRKPREKKGDVSDRTCPHCSKVCERPSEMSRHALTHTNNRPYACSFPGCDRSFTQSGQLNIHMRKHYGDKPHMCDWPGCGKSFADKGSLGRHRVVHDKSSSFECPHPGCGKAYARRSTLNRHIQSSHNRKREHKGESKDTPRGNFLQKGGCPSDASEEPSSDQASKHRRRSQEPSSSADIDLSTDSVQPPHLSELSSIGHYHQWHRHQDTTSEGDDIILW